MDYINQPPPTPFGTRLPAAILTRIYHLAITYPSAIPLDSTRREPFYPPLLQTSSQIRSRFLPAFFETNTFTIRRASLCKRAENRKNPALMPMSHRVHVRQLQLVTYDGDSECLKYVPGDSHCGMLLVKRASCRLTKRRPKQKQQQQSCSFCNSSTFPPLLAVFPRLRVVTVDVAANRDSGLAWRAFCKATVRDKRRVWVAYTGIGEGVLVSEERRLGMKIRIVDGKMRRVWEIVAGLDRDEVRRFVEYGWRSEGVGEAMRLSERVADGLLRLCWYFDEGNRNADGGDEGVSIRAESGSLVVDDGNEQRASTRKGVECRTAHLHRWLGLSTYTESGGPAVDGSNEHMVLVRKDSGRPACSEAHEQMRTNRTGTKAANTIDDQRDLTGTKDIWSPKRPMALGWDACTWSRDFLTPLNWALRVWLMREIGDEDHEYVRIVEGGGIRDVVAAEDMKAILLEEFSSIPQRGEFRAGV